MNKRIIPLIVVAGLVAAGFVVDRNRAAARSVLSGVFESQPSRLAPKVSGRVEQILVKEGDTVKKGQPLVRLAMPEVRYQSDANKALAEQAEAKLREAENGSRAEEIQRQRAALSEAQANLEKLLNGARPEEIGAAKASVRQAEAKLRELQNGSRPEEIAKARAALQAAKAQLAITQRGPSEEDKARLEQDLKAADADLAYTELTRDRKKRLWEQGAVAKMEFDVAENQYEKALAKHRQAALSLERARKGSPAEEVRAAQEGVKQAEAQLELTLAGARREEIQAAEAAVGAARENLRLLTNGSRSEDIAAARAKVSQMEAALRELENGTRPEQISQAKAAATAAQAQAEGSQASADERTIFAPKDGLVERVLVADGDLVGPSVPAIQMSAPSDLWLRVYVPEKNLTSIRVGDEAELAVDGITEHLVGVVESIATQGEFTPANLQTPEERGKQVFAVRIRLKQPDSRVKSGVAVTVVGFRGTVVSEQGDFFRGQGAFIGGQGTGHRGQISVVGGQGGRDGARRSGIASGLGLAQCARQFYAHHEASVLIARGQGTGYRGQISVVVGRDGSRRSGIASGLGLAQCARQFYAHPEASVLLARGRGAGYRGQISVVGGQGGRDGAWRSGIASGLGLAQCASQLYAHPEASVLVVGGRGAGGNYQFSGFRGQGAALSSPFAWGEEGGGDGARRSGIASGLGLAQCARQLYAHPEASGELRLWGLS